jgi:shikimate dehydrogenase
VRPSPAAGQPGGGIVRGVDRGTRAVALPGARPGAAWPSGTTTLVGVIGDPVRHSRSPAIHNAAFAHLGMDWAYVAFPVAAGAATAAVRGAHALGVRGLSVTMPHKQQAAELADRRSPEVELLGAANTLVLDASGASAHSTDGAGFLADLRRGLGFEPAGATCAVLGAGGAARSVVLALARAGASSVLVCNRSAERGRSAAALAGAAGALVAPEDLAAAALVVNATPVGMAGAAEGEQLPPGLLGALHAGQAVYDLVYHPLETPLMVAAGRRGARVRGGLGMLVHQAAEQFRLFTGEDAPLEVMWHAALGR